MSSPVSIDQTKSPAEHRQEKKRSSLVFCSRLNLLFLSLSFSSLFATGVEANNGFKGIVSRDRYFV
jgi:hypothetical protein